jgi:hypothetical protein
MDLSEIKKSSLSIEKDLMKKEIKRDELIKQIELKNEEMLEIQSTKDKTNRAGLFLKSKAHDTRKKSCESIDEMITKAIKMIYGADYSFNLKYKDTSGEINSKSSFNIIPSITSNQEGQMITTTIKDSRGGGLIEVMSVLLRLAFLNLSGYNGLVILDETWAAVSADNKMSALIDFFEGYIKSSKVQIVLITHRAEMFGKIADNILHVKKEDGLANVRSVSYQEYLEELK